VNGFNVVYQLIAM